MGAHSTVRSRNHGASGKKDKEHKDKKDKKHKDKKHKEPLLSYSDDEDSYVAKASCMGHVGSHLETSLQRAFSYPITRKDGTQIEQPHAMAHGYLYGRRGLVPLVKFAVPIVLMLIVQGLLWVLTYEGRFGDLTDGERAALCIPAMVAAILAEVCIICTIRHGRSAESDLEHESLEEKHLPKGEPCAFKHRRILHLGWVLHYIALGLSILLDTCLTILVYTHAIEASYSILYISVCVSMLMPLVAIWIGTHRFSTSMLSPSFLHEHSAKHKGDTSLD